MAPGIPGATSITVKAGSVVTLKFELFKDMAKTQEIKDVAAVKSITSTKVSCDPTVTTDEIESLAGTVSALRFDTTGDQFIMNWNTPAAGCYRVTMTSQDGQTISALFKTR